MARQLVLPSSLKYVGSPKCSLETAVYVMFKNVLESGFGMELIGLVF
jgi:hypothetical protein